MGTGAAGGGRGPPDLFVESGRGLGAENDGVMLAGGSAGGSDFKKFKGTGGGGRGRVLKRQAGGVQPGPGLQAEMVDTDCDGAHGGAAARLDVNDADGSAAAAQQLHQDFKARVVDEADLAGAGRSGRGQQVRS